MIAAGLVGSNLRLIDADKTHMTVTHLPGLAAISIMQK